MPCQELIPYNLVPNVLQELYPVLIQCQRGDKENDC